MRWLLVSSQHHASHGGIGTYVDRFVRSAAAAGWAVDLITRPGAQQPPARTIIAIVTSDQHAEFELRMPALRRLERIRPYRYGLWARAVAHAIGNLHMEYDAIEFVDCQGEGVVALCDRKVRRHCGSIPMLVHAHTPMYVEERINQADETRFGRTIYHAWERQALANADGIIATSRTLLEQLPANGPTACIPYPIDADDTIYPQGDRAAVIVYVGTLQPRKGAYLLIESWNRLFAEQVNVRGVIVGADTMTGPNGTSMLNWLQSRVQPEHRHRVTFAGVMNHDDVRRTMAGASLVVVPSVLESFSFAAAEALLCGTPVLVSDAVGIAEHIPMLPRFAAGSVEACARLQRSMLMNMGQSLRHAQQCQQHMLKVCSGETTLRLRAAFVNTVRTQSRAAAELYDAAGEMDGFLNSIEAAERTVAAATDSNAKSYMAHT